MKFWFQETDQRLGQKRTEQYHRRWWLLGVAAFCAFLSILIGLMWYANNTNIGLGLGACILIVLSFIFGREFFISLSNKTIIRTKKDAVVTDPKKANTLVISAVEDKTGKREVDTIEFIEQLEPTGKLHKIVNLNEEFYIVRVLKKPEQRIFFPDKLPDCEFYDPGRYGAAVTLPAHFAYFKPSPTLGQLIKPVFLLLAAIALMIGDIVVISPKGG